MISRSLEIISGGQTGVDRAAMDVALELGLPVSGWCPAGRWAEDGPIDARYPLRETLSKDPAVRTERNVEDANGTLVISRDMEIDAGTEWTLECCQQEDKPLYVLRMDKWDNGHALRLQEWIQEYQIEKLNVAGPRESFQTGIYAETKDLLHRLLRSWMSLA